MASAEEDLECGLCLNTYKSPKFLPCFHTFCEGCVEDLVKNTGNIPLKCPKCRQKFQLPSGGVSKLQTNFYLTPLLKPERCMLHRTETLRLYCTVCNKLFHPIPLQQSVTIREVFRCCEDTQLYVHAVCVDSCFNTVFVAYGASGTGGEGREVRRHRPRGELMYKSSETIRGRVCLGGLNRGWVRVEGKEFQAKDWLIHDFNTSGNKSAERKYDVYNKGDTRFVAPCSRVRSV
ncbi:hypothetical protein V1264_018262 [Littorina saxatilis]|uniref:RING-type domain-containing protein n=1 Tax=Littorina saxatilis TaxID=31220 RepID=A0AAN9BCA1_9CAEN